MSESKVKKVYSIEKIKRGIDIIYTVYMVTETGYNSFGTPDYVRVLAEFGNTTHDRNLKNAQLFVKALELRENGLI